MITPKICALIVSYNRKELLLESLAALLKQSCSLTEILIIDNYSTSELVESLHQNNYIENYNNNFIINGGILSKNILNQAFKSVKITFYRLNKNTGGAGGFNMGMRYFYEKTPCDFLWLMDDDCKADINALQNLVNAYEHLTSIRQLKIGFIASRVNWLDNSPCKIASPFIKSTTATTEYSISSPYLELESAAFVSLFFARQIILEVGLPIKEYFIWNDDVEYTTRVNKQYRSFLALNSIVIHQTKANLAAEEIITPENFFKNCYGIRNKISWLRHEKSLAHTIFFSLKFTKLALCSKISIIKKLILIKSIIYGWGFNPKKEYLNNK